MSGSDSEIRLKRLADSREGVDMLDRRGFRQRPLPAHRQRIRRLVITDVDNTLYDFGAYFEAGLRGLTRATAQTLGMSQQQTLHELKEVFLRHGSMEYPFAIEEFPAVTHLPSEHRSQTVDTCLNAFWDGARSAIRPYPGVLFALRHLRREGIAVMAFTDAPIHEALRRLRAIGVDRDLTGVVATQWFGRRKKRTAVLRITDVPGFVQVPRRFTVVGRLADDQRKPNPQTYRDIMNSFNLAPEQVTVIGDSPGRDLEPAASLGMQAVWARYGGRDPGREKLLRQVVPFRLPEAKAKQDQAATSFPAVDRFDELLDLLPTRQTHLPIPI